MSTVILNIVHMSFARVYQFKGLTFEHHDYLGPTMLRRKTHKDRDYRAIKGRQWGLYYQWLRLPFEQREQFRIGL